MGQTLVEKILSYKYGKKVYAGDVIMIEPDLIMGTDGTAPLAINILQNAQVTFVKYPERVVFICDHFSPSHRVSDAKIIKDMKEFAMVNNIKFFDVGDGGICHVVIPERMMFHPYDVVAGADSHTCTYGGLGAFSIGIGSTDLAGVMASGKLWMKVPKTIKIVLHGKLAKNVTAKDIILHLIGILGENGATYKVLEFTGEAVAELDVTARLTLCNMATECGAKTAIVNSDEVTRKYYSGEINYEVVMPDQNAQYDKIIDIELSNIQPMIACPYSPANVVDAVTMVGKKINQVVIGSCTNGRIEDFRLVHKILKNNVVNEHVKLLLIPGSQNVLKQIASENMLEDFITANAVILSPTCGPCMGGHSGVLADNEVGLYTTNRNFYGRNGATSSKVYLCNPIIAAYSAIKGSIQVPEK